jgi:hypothetical protein
MTILNMPIFHRAVITPAKGSLRRPVILVDRIPLKIPDYGRWDAEEVGILERRMQTNGPIRRIRYVKLNGQLYRELGGDADAWDRTVPVCGVDIAPGTKMTADRVQSFLDTRIGPTNMAPYCPLIQWRIDEYDMARRNRHDINDHKNPPDAIHWIDIDHVCNHVRKNVGKLAFIDGSLYTETIGPIIKAEAPHHVKISTTIGSLLVAGDSNNLRCYPQSTFRFDCPEEIKVHIINKLIDRVYRPANCTSEKMVSDLR